MTHHSFYEKFPTKKFCGTNPEIIIECKEKRTPSPHKEYRWRVTPFTKLPLILEYFLDAFQTNIFARFFPFDWKQMVSHHKHLKKNLELVSFFLFSNFALFPHSLFSLVIRLYTASTCKNINSISIPWKSPDEPAACWKEDSLRYLMQIFITP